MSTIKKDKFRVVWDGGCHQKCKSMSEVISIVKDLLKTYSSVTIEKL